MKKITYTCDLCGEEKTTFVTRIENKVYDICQDCRARILEPLSGKGEVVYDNGYTIWNSPAGSSFSNAGYYFPNANVKDDGHIVTVRTTDAAGYYSPTITSTGIGTAAQSPSPYSIETTTGKSK